MKKAVRYVTVFIMLSRTEAMKTSFRESGFPVVVCVVSTMVRTANDAFLTMGTANNWVGKKIKLEQ